MEAMNPEDFARPPSAAFPWLYGLWMDGNVSKEGITADLESMKRAGIAGLTLMDAGARNPSGPHRFMSGSWLGLFDHIVQESARLGIEINLHNAPGVSGSGGPWVKPEQASQKVIAAEAYLQGPMSFSAKLPRPAGIHRDFYQDIAVLAYPVRSDDVPLSFRIPDYDSTKSFAGGQDYFDVVPWPRFIPTSDAWPAAPHRQCLQSGEVRDLSSQLRPDDTFEWQVPPGKWLVMRLGHTLANGTPRTVQPGAEGLECNKLDEAAVESHFEAMIGTLARRAGAFVGRALVAAHIDSWEAGSGNWARQLPGEFRRRRGYDLLPFLPTLNGIVVDDRERSERFLWDFRETVCELVLDNYAARFARLAREAGLRLSIEAFDGPCDDLRYAGRADEPMSEFWQGSYSGLPLGDLSESMASAAHVYGRNIVAAEAFTSYRGDFLDHPATLKPLADWAFCTGVNRLCFHHWVFQQRVDLEPGIPYLIVGTVFQRTLTWWDHSWGWHEYIARCQHMLRQGRFVADICFVAPEGAPLRFTPPIPAHRRGGTPFRPEYNFDGCPAELVVREMTVRDGAVELPSGMSYRLLVLPTFDAAGEPVMRLCEGKEYIYRPLPLPRIRTMTVELLRRVKKLLADGAIVLGFRPEKSPSLSGFPACDEEIRRIADEIWGENAGRSGVGERHVGRGRIVWGRSPEEVLAAMRIPPDLCGDSNVAGKLNYTHRRTADGTDIYFVASSQPVVVQGEVRFRASSAQPELYWPQTGAREPAVAFAADGGCTTLPMTFQRHESVFVVFRRKPAEGDPIVAAFCEGRALWPRGDAEPVAKDVDDSFDTAVWVNAAWLQDIVLPAREGDRWVYPASHALIPGPGIQTYTSPGQGHAGFIVGRNGVVVFRHLPDGSVEPLLVHSTHLTGPSVLVAVTYAQRTPRLFIDGALVAVGQRNSRSLSARRGALDRRPIAGALPALQQFDEMRLQTPHSGTAALDLARGEIWSPGSYEFRTARNRRWKRRVELPQPLEICGPWRIRFDADRGGPAETVFETLTDWRHHNDERIRYFSGTAVYRAIFDVPDARKHPLHRCYLDLGEVAVTADVVVNGARLGVLWKAPFRIDVTEVIRRGENTLEIAVANLWVNRLIGDERLEEDGERSPDGLLTRWPKWMLDGQRSPAGRKTFAPVRMWTRDSPLVRSGLLGPVRLIASERIA